MIMNTCHNFTENSYYNGDMLWSPKFVRIRLNNGKIMRLGKHSLEKAQSIAKQLGFKLRINGAFRNLPANGSGLRML